MACPPMPELESLLGAPPESMPEVRAHVRSCRACQETLERLADDTELREWATPAAGGAAGASPTVAGGLTGFMQLLADESWVVPRPPEDEAMPLGAPLRPEDLGTLGHYLIEAEIGRGGMGVVYRAHDPSLRRTVALKALRSGQGHARIRFVREAQAAAQVRHDHVVAVYAVADPEQGPAYLVMEHLAGPSLANLIAQRGRLGAREAAEFCAQAADGLAAAHAAGLVHRDVKPANILLDPATGRAKIADFGLARPVADSSLTQEGAVVGTPSYMSPEQARGEEKLDARTDVYGLGATLYEALTGEAPFRGAGHMVVKQVIEDEPRPPRRLNDAVPPAMETICLKAMAKEPSRRYESAGALSDDLRRFLRGEPVLAKPAGPIERLLLWRRRNPRVAGLTAAIFLLLVLVAVGSTAAAFWIDAERRQSEKDRRAAQLAEQKAAANAQAAAAQRQLALDTLNSVIIDVQRMLATQPGTLRLKQRLLEKAAAGLEQITRTPGDGPDVDGAKTEALIRLGDLRLQLGRTAEARQTFDRARALAAGLISANARDLHSQSRLAQALDRLGDLDLSGGEVKGAEANYQEARRLRERLLPDAGAEPAVFRDATRRSLTVSLNKLGDVELRRGDALKARELFAQSLDSLGRLEQPDLALLRRDRAFTRGRLGNASVALFDFAAAREHFQAALNECQSLANAAPEDTQTRADLAVSFERLGSVELRLFDFAAAEADYRRAFGIRQALAAADPDSAEASRNFVADHSQLGDVLRCKGDLDGARAIYTQGLERMEKLQRADPASPQKQGDVLLIMAYLSDTEERAGRFAAVVGWHERMLDACDRFLKESEKNPAAAAALKSYRDNLAPDLPVYRAAAAGDIDDAAKIKGAPPAVAAGLWRVRARRLARQGRFTEAIEAAEAFRKADKDSANSRFVATQVHALHAKAVLNGREPGALSPEERAQWERHANAAATELREAWRAAPQPFRSSPLPLDLDGLRGHAAYQALLREMGGRK